MFHVTLEYAEIIYCDNKSDIVKKRSYFMKVFSYKLAINHLKMI